MLLPLSSIVRPYEIRFYDVLYILLLSARRWHPAQRWRRCRARLIGSAGVEVAQHIAKLCWLVVDQMGVERTEKLSVVVAGQRLRKMDRSSVVVGEDLSTRDGKVKLSVKKNACSSTDQK